MGPAVCRPSRPLLAAAAPPGLPPIPPLREGAAELAVGAEAHTRGGACEKPSALTCPGRLFITLSREGLSYSLVDFFFF